MSAVDTYTGEQPNPFAGPHIVYAIRDSAGSTRYVGVTNDFHRRLAEHSRRPEFAGCKMHALCVRGSRVEAESIEARTISVLRPPFNKVIPTGAPTRTAKRLDSPIATILKALFG